MQESLVLAVYRPQKANVYTIKGFQPNLFKTLTRLGSEAGEEHRSEAYTKEHTGRKMFT